MLVKYEIPTPNTFAPIERRLVTGLVGFTQAITGCNTENNDKRAIQRVDNPSLVICWLPAASFPATAPFQGEQH